MQQHGVVAGLGDRQVKTCVRGPLFGTTHLFVTRITVLQRIECRGQPLAIHISGAQRSVVGAGRLQRMAKLEQIALRLGIAFQQMQQGITEGGTQ
ncbi:hypothetical protein D3C72_1857580 [compost metagenome]